MIPAAVVAPEQKWIADLPAEKSHDTQQEPTFAGSQTPIVIRPSKTDAPTILPIASACAPSTNPLCVKAARGGGSRSGPKRNTNRSDGRSIPIVETIVHHKDPAKTKLCLVKT